MKPSLETPTITAHALGELNPAEERLLRMTFHDPSYARQLEEECAELRQISGKLANVLKTESRQFSLTDEQREAIFSKTAAPYPAGYKHPAAPVNKQPISFQKAVEERRKFDRKPARLATYLTGGAAAAIIILLGSLPSKEGASSASAKSQLTRIATQDDIDARAPKMKVVKARPEKEAKDRESKRSYAGAPNTRMDMFPNSELPDGQVRNQSTDAPLPVASRSTVPKPEIPAMANTQKKAAEPKVEMDITNKKKVGTYSSQKQ